MIPIKINGQKFWIKSFDELTTSGFIELQKIENPDLIKYIAWQTGISQDDAFYATISNTVINAIGSLKDITKIKCSKKFDYSKIIETVGQRHQIEASKKEGYDLIVFILAVSQARSNNIDEVNRLYKYYLKQPYIEILPAGFFFYRILGNGSKQGLRLFDRLRVLIKMPVSNKLQEYSD